jgi:hypothetical protein
MILLRLRLRLDDEPGRLAPIAAQIASRCGNILSFGVLYDAKGGVVDDIIVQVPEDVDLEELTASLTTSGCHDVTPCPADARALIDTPTHMLNLAARLVEQPGALRTVLAELLDADEVIVLGAEARKSGLTRSSDTITLALPDGRAVRVRRNAPPFTFTEEVRGRALIRLTQSLAAKGAQHPSWALIPTNDEGGTPPQSADATVTMPEQWRAEGGRRGPADLLVTMLNPQTYLLGPRRVVRGLLDPWTSAVKRLGEAAVAPAQKVRARVRLPTIVWNGHRGISLEVISDEVPNSLGSGTARNKARTARTAFGNGPW